MPETAAFCPGCGRIMQTEARLHGRVGIFPENIAGALAYMFFPAVAFLVLKPYNNNRFLRFHSFQCLFLCAALLLIAIAIKLVGFVLLIIPVLGRLFLVLMAMVVVLATVVVWLVLIVKALQGEPFKLPVLGDLADQFASAY
jgi:uncharacterized membrane protein